MPKYANCSCGGLCIDNDTLKIDPATRNLYVNATTGEEEPVYTSLESMGYTEPYGELSTKNSTLMDKI